MILKVIAEQARNILTGGSPTRDTNFEMQDLVQYARELLADIVKANLFQNKQDGLSDIDGSFIFTFNNIPVQFDSGNGLFFSEVPSTYVALPNEAGIDSISLPQGQTRNFIKVQRNFLTLSNGLLINDLEGNYGYWSEGKYVYYVVNRLPVPKKVTMKLAAGMDGIEDTTQILLPLDAQLGLVDKIVARFQTELQIPADKNNDNRAVNTASTPKT